MEREKYIYHGKSYASLRELSRECGKSAPTLRNRIKNMGMSVDDAVDLPLQKRRIKKKFPCGATGPFDCLECRYKDCIAINLPAMHGENGWCYAFGDSKQEDDK